MKTRPPERVFFVCFVPRRYVLAIFFETLGIPSWSSLDYVVAVFVHIFDIDFKTAAL